MLVAGEGCLSIKDQYELPERNMLNQFPFGGNAEHCPPYIFLRKFSSSLLL